MEQMLLRLRELQPEVPSWAKAEQMEISVPQTELWKYADEPTPVITKKRKRIQAGEVS
jgi:hypothetical protein